MTYSECIALILTDRERAKQQKRSPDDIKTFLRQPGRYDHDRTFHPDDMPPPRREPQKKRMTAPTTRKGQNVLKVDFKKKIEKVVDEVRKTAPPPSPPKRPKRNADFGERLQRIRSSLEKINHLMAELKRVKNEEQKPTVVP